MADQVTIKNGTVTADTVNVDIQLNANTVSVNGDVTVTGNVSLNGKDIIETIQEQKAELQEHATNIGLVTSPHLSEAEHEKLAQVISLFETYDTATSIPVVNAPTSAGAIDLEYFPNYFKTNAMVNWDLSTAPGHVFVSRVPYAVYDEADGKYHFLFSSLKSAGSAYEEYSTFGDNVPDKLLDNVYANGSSRQHTCSTDTVEGADDYVGKEWAFFWEYGNYIKDSKGIKHLTSIRGVGLDSSGNINGTSFKASEFDIKKNTAAFGPVFWFFCKPEKRQDPVSGEWSTYDRTENGSPITQLWGISDSPWDAIDADHPMYNGVVYQGISAERKAKLEALGITADDFHIWPECVIIDQDTQTQKIRPYWIHSAFCGGYNAEIINENPAIACVSICNAPLRGNLSYQALNAPSGYAAANAPGGACVNGFGMLFDIVKNATKNSQSIHAGYASGSTTSVTATRSITAAQQELLKSTYGGYVFPVNGFSSSSVGRTVRLESDINLTTGENNKYSTSVARQIGRIKAVRTDLAFEDASGNSLTNIAGIIIDPAENTVNPVRPFAVCGTDLYTDAAGAKAAAQALTNGDDVTEGVYAACSVCLYTAMGGETMNGGATGTGVIGKHDGSVVSNSDNVHLYRVQGTEYMPGCWICAADTVAVRGNGTEIPYNDSTITPDATNYVILTCPAGTNRLNSTSTNPLTWTNAGYEVVGLAPYSGGYISNVQLATQGVAYPVLKGASNATGHADNSWSSTTNPVEFLSGGNLTYGSEAGSAALYLGHGLGAANWFIAARD